MSQVAVFAKIAAAPGKRAALRAALQSLLDGAENEAGTLMYLLHEDNADENLLWMYELYASQEALKLHMGSEGFKAAGPTLAPFLAGRPELNFVTPTGGKGLPS